LWLKSRFFYDGGVIHVFMFRFCYLIPLIKLSLGLGRFPSNNRFSNSLIPLLPLSFFNSLVLSRHSPVLPLSVHKEARQRSKIQGARGLDLKDLLLLPSSPPSLPWLLVLIMLGLEKKKRARVDFQHIH